MKQKIDYNGRLYNEYCKISYYYNDVDQKVRYSCVINAIDSVIERKDITHEKILFYKDLKLVVEKNVIKSECKWVGNFKITENINNSDYKIDASVIRYSKKFVATFNHINKYDDKIKSISDKIKSDKIKSNNDIFYDNVMIYIFNYYSEDGWLK